MTSQLELTQRPFIELQIEALVAENRIRAKRVNAFIDALETKLLSIQESDYDKLLDRVFKLPLIGRPNSSNSDYPSKFAFAPPDQLNVIGGFRTSTAIKKSSYVDLAVPMPKGCLDKKDIKNQKYFNKRALYLAQIGHLLGKSIGQGLIKKIEFTCYLGDVLKPVLILVPECPKLKKSTTFRMFAYPQEGALKTSILHPSHGNIAPKWFFKDYIFEEEDAETYKDFIDGDSDAAPSPFYNSSLLFDIELVSNSNILYEQVGVHVSMMEALVLTKIWLFQRGLRRHFSFIISMYMAYLQTKQAVHQNMSSYQIFKTIIKSIASSDWHKTGLSYFDDSTEKISSFQQSFTVVFLSPSGNLNLCYNITYDLYDRLKHEAHLSQNLLATQSTDIFELLFLRKLEFISKFDVITHVPKCAKKVSLDLHNLKKFMDHGALIPRAYSEVILDLVRKALTDRVVLVQQDPDGLLLDKRWNLKSAPYDPKSEDSSFTFGLLIEPEKSLRIIDVGPEAQTEKAEEFRKFWEPKCQLRLQNGIISETVVWHLDSFSQRRAIIKYILYHALKRADIHKVTVHYTLLERFISLQNVFFLWRNESQSIQEDASNGGAKKRKHDESNQAKQPIGAGEEVFQRVLHAYNGLSKLLRGVEGLKHMITGIQPISHHLRASAVFPPFPVSLQPRNKSLKRRKGVTLFSEDFGDTSKILHLEPVEILLTLDSTGKWPSDLEAFKAARLDYIIKLGEALKEREYCVKFNEDCLDVMFGQFIFRLQIKCPKQLVIAASCGKQEYHRSRFELEILPRVHSALDQLYREKPAFGLTCRLVKRWVSCHLMTDHISDISLDLMVAHLFISSQPYTEPASSSCGFLRFLTLLAEHDWDNQPLIINFDGQLKLDEVKRIKDTMLEDRSKLPPIVLCTPHDKELSPWTRLSPNKEQLELLVQISTKAVDYFKKEILYHYEVSEKCKNLFKPDFKLFNIIIKLQQNTVQNFFMSIYPPKSYKLSGSEPVGKGTSAFNVMPIVGLNIVEQYVKLLRNKYGHVALFFYDKFGQRIIGVRLNPNWEELLGYDLDKLVADMKSLGSKLVESVSVAY